MRPFLCSVEAEYPAILSGISKERITGMRPCGDTVHPKILVPSVAEPSGAEQQARSFNKNKIVVNLRYELSTFSIS